MERILVSRRHAESLGGLAPSSLRALVSRGRLVEDDALIGERIVKGVTLKSLAEYFGWSPRVVDELLVSHGIDPDSEGYHFMTTRDEVSVDEIAD